MLLEFVSYKVTDTGVEFQFQNINGVRLYVSLLDAELAAITTQVQLHNALESKLRRKINRENIATKLDPFIGQTITI